MKICNRCQRHGHNEKDCFARRDANGEIIPARIEESDSEDDADSDYLGSDSENEE